MVSCRAKAFFLTSLVLYTVYLLTFKCIKLQESPLEHAGETILHPLTHTHNQLCDKLSQGEKFVQPYLSSAKDLLDKHVYSHPKYVEFEVEKKIGYAQQQYYNYVYPLVIKLFQLIEIAEVHITEQLIQVYAKLQALYYEKVAPKLA